MKNPSQQRLERQKHQLLHEIYKQNNPLLFRERKPRHKRKAPLESPCYNPSPNYNTSKAIELRALISYLSEHGHSQFMSLTSDDLVIILDSGATCCMSPYPDDFKDSTLKVKQCNIGGIGSGLEAKGIGIATWTITNTEGKQIPLDLECLYVPNLPCRLMCPQQLGNAKQTSSYPNGAWITTAEEKALQEKVFQSITFFGNQPEEWKYTDDFDKNPSRQFFDCYWDIDAIKEHH